MRPTLPCALLAFAFLFASAVISTDSEDGDRLSYAIDHVGILLDRETVQAMAASQVLRDEFAHARYSSSTQIEGGQWSGIYIYGALTYLEFTDSFQVPGIEAEIGNGMVAFNAEKAGSVEWIAERMGELHPESNPTTRLRHVSAGDRRVPFTHTAMFAFPGGHQGFGAWVTEYHRDFKSTMSGGMVPAGDISRVRGAPPVAHHPNKLFQDVVSVTAAVPDTRSDQLVQLLTAMGYDIEEQAERTVCTGSESVIELIPKTDQKYAITRIVVSLTRPKTGENEYRFGPEVSLRFSEGPEAVWEFGGTTDETTDLNEASEASN